ncbi:MAG: leucine-rich repeat domain-containing protein, partial [Clostridia bacterium]|nr:leucine-rich repeat domain-containing protein [Clostridia bacterium]
MKHRFFQHKASPSRALAALLSFLLLLCCLLPLSACNREESCQHRDADDNALCDKCGQSFSDQNDTAAPHTHTYGAWTLATTATCVKAGEERQTCACGEFLSRELPPTGEHLYGTDDLCSMCGEAYEDIGLVFTLQDGTYTVSGYTGTAGEVVIPAQYKGIAVTAVGEQAFYLNKVLTAITIPSSITDIGKSAFRSCRKLTHLYYNAISVSSTQKVFESAGSEPDGITVFIGASVTKIPEFLFYGDPVPDITSVIFAENSHLDTIEHGAFLACYGLTSITIPKSVTKISSMAFNSCSNLSSITFEEGSRLVTIGGQAFNGCHALTSIELPASLTSFGDFTFASCTSLSSVTFGENSCLTTIGGWAFNGCSSLSSISIPPSVLSIGPVAFEGCNGLIKKEGTFSYVDRWVIDCENDVTEVTLRDGTMGIGTGAFRGCGNLASVTIPDSVISIDEAAFSNCISLTSFTVPQSATYIGKNAFSGCSRLATVTIPASVTVISDSAFDRCSALTTVTIGENSRLTTIGKYAFFECASLASFDIPAGVTQIGPSAFAGCFNLTQFKLASATNKLFYVYNGVLYKLDSNGVAATLLAYPAGRT